MESTSGHPSSTNSKRGFASLAYLAYLKDSGSPMQGPKRKIPCISFTSSSASTSRFLGDSTLIIEKLVEEGELPDLNAKLSPKEKVMDLAVGALLEDKLYFYQVCSLSPILLPSHERRREKMFAHDTSSVILILKMERLRSMRYLNEKWHQIYYTMRPHVLGALPYPAQVIVGLLAYRKMKVTLHGQGVLRYTDAEIASLRREIWEGINTLLVSSKTSKRDDGKPFWVCGGEGPSETDATVLGFVVAVLVCGAYVISPHQLILLLVKDWEADLL